MTDESNEEAAVPEVVQTAREQPAGALLPSRFGVLPALPDDIPDADVPALLEDIERRVEALPGAFDAALARKQVVAGNAMAVAMQARNLRRVTDRALALIEARLAALMPANPPGRPPQPVEKPDGQLAGSDAGEPDRVQTAAPMPADPSDHPSRPVGTSSRTTSTRTSSNTQQEPRRQVEPSPLASSSTTSTHASNSTPQERRRQPELEPPHPPASSSMTSARPAARRKE